MLDSILIAKLALGIPVAALGVLLCPSQLLQRITNVAFWRWALGVAIVSRLGVFLALYVILGQSVRMDVSAYYLPQAQAALSGQLPYRDFVSSYGPLFPYVSAIAVWFWPSAKAIVLLTILLEIISVPIWVGVGRRLVSENAVRIAAVLYLTNPLVILYSPVLGYNQAWISLCLAGAIWLLLRQRNLLSGLAMGASIVAVKILGIIFVPVLALTARRRLIWCVSLLLASSVVYAPLLAMHVDILQPIRTESALTTSGNLPYLLTAVGIQTSGTAGAIWTAVLLAGMAAVFLPAAWRHRQEPVKIVLPFLGLVFMTFMILSRKAYPQYLVTCMFALCLAAAEQARSKVWIPLLLAGLSQLLCLEPSLRGMWLNEMDFNMLRAGDASLRAGAIALLAVEVVVLVGYVWLWRLFYQAVWRPQESGSLPARALP